MFEHVIIKALFKINCIIFDFLKTLQWPKPLPELFLLPLPNFNSEFYSWKTWSPHNCIPINLQNSCARTHSFRHITFFYKLLQTGKFHLNIHYILILLIVYGLWWWVRQNVVSYWCASIFKIKLWLYFLQFPQILFTIYPSLM